MFETPKVSALVQNVSFQGKDEKKMLRMQFYVTPITYELAAEVSPHVADRLFRKGPDGNWSPASEVPSIRFELGNIPLQSMEFHPAEDQALDHTGILVNGASISGISATKLFPDNPNFTLMFHAEMALDSMTVELARKYFKRVVYITMADLQGELFPNADVKDTTTNPTCEECEDRAVIRDSENSYYCQKHVRKGKGEVHWLVTKESPAQAAKRIAAERDGKSAAAGKDDQPELVMGGTVAPVEDMSHANRKRGGKTKREAVN